jgi:hypothetical protein
MLNAYSLAQLAYKGHCAVYSWLPTTRGVPMTHSSLQRFALYIHRLLATAPALWVRCHAVTPCVSFHSYETSLGLRLLNRNIYALLCTRKSCRWSDTYNITNNHQNNHEIHNSEISKLISILLLYKYVFII